MSIEDVKEQTIGAYIAYLNEQNLEELQASLQDILSKEIQDYNAEDVKLLEVLLRVENVKEFIKNPNHILGSEMTKHGEIAEQFDVMQRNCTRILEGLKADATFEGVGRTAPEDYIIAAQEVQSKFYNGINSSLKAVLEHNEKYEYFGTNGKSYYVIPKDQYEAIQRMLKGDKNVYINGESLKLNTVQKAKELVRLIEDRTGRPFDEVTRPSSFTYEEIQLGKANQTLSNQEAKYEKNIRENKREIKDNANNDRQAAYDQAKPNFSDASKIAGIACIFGGGVSLGLSIHKKVKAGKKIENFTTQDWKDLGLDTSKGALKGGLTGYSIYYQTNLYNIPAPIASAYTAAAFGVLNIANQYRKGEIEGEEFVEMSQIVCLDSTLNAIGATLGQVVIPIPMLGCIIGGITANVLSSFGKDYLNKRENKLIARYNREFEKKIFLLDEKYKTIYDDIISEYKRLYDITVLAFDFEMNNKLRLQASIELAVEYGVEDSEILKNCVEVDSYFCS